MRRGRPVPAEGIGALDGAHARLRLTELLIQLGDLDGAKLELAAARAILQRLGVRTSLSRWVELERKLG